MKKVGLYIHIPFCLKKCRYCDFCSFENKKNNDIEEYISALLTEMETWKEKLNEYEIKSIFIGGGTPTVVSIKETNRLFEALYKSFRISNTVEFSIESNPGTLNDEKIKYYLKSGINRLSMGLQAWQDRLLKDLGRIHNRKEFVVNFISARELGFTNINVDLMFGLPGQKLKDWKETLEKTVSLKPDHLSTYGLKLEQGTELYSMYEAGELMLPTDKLDRKMYHYTIEYLTTNGYSHYEISNFAAEGKECIHNKIYWNNEDYVGIGVGAHSYLNRKRFSNIDNLESYIGKLKKNMSPVVFEEKGSLKEEIEETMFLGLRMVKGINLIEFKERFGISPLEIYSGQVIQLKKKGLLYVDDNKICLTEKGYDLANQVFSEFLLDDTVNFKNNI